MASKTEYKYDDDELVYYVHESHEEAKEVLYDKYIPLLYKEINNVKKEALARGVNLADLAQVGLIAFSNAIDNYKSDEDVKFITFATICIKRNITTYLKQAKRQKRNEKIISLDTPVSQEQSIIDFVQDKKSIDPLKQLINKERVEEVLRRANQLSKNELEALKYELAGLKHEEIGKKLNKTPKQVYNLIHRAHTKIKKDRYITH